MCIRDSKRGEDKNTTDDLIAKMTDRSHKFQAPEMLRPGAQFPSEDAAIQAFVLRRDSTIEYIKSTQDDLKDHFVAHPLFGTVDLYQVLILLEMCIRDRPIAARVRWPNSWSGHPLELSSRGTC